MSPPPTPTRIRRILAADPGDARAMYAWAGTRMSDRPTEALGWARRAGMVQPLAVPPRTREAQALLQLGRCREGHAASRRGLLIDPADWSSWINLGIFQKRFGDTAAALRSCARASLLGAPDKTAVMNAAVLRLRAGDFAAGWRMYRARHQSLGADPAAIWPALPEWDGQPLAGRLRVLTEQGIGDTIMFLTLLHALRDRVGAITLLVNPRLERLLRRSFPSLDVVAPDPTGALPWLPDAAAWVCAGDLPALLGLFTGGVDVPRPYLKADPGRARRLRERLVARHPGKRLVGITWTSRAEDGWRRTVPPAMWLPIADIEHVALVSLQYGATTTDLATFGHRVDSGHGVEPLQDLDGLVALVAAMDAVVSPTNNTVHFAGALGVPSHVMLPVDPDWRWGEDGAASRWYDTARLYRQRREGDWRPVIDEVAQGLRQMADGTR